MGRPWQYYEKLILIHRKPVLYKMLVQKQAQWHPWFPDVSACAVEDEFISLQNPDKKANIRSSISSVRFGLLTLYWWPSAIDVWAFFSCYVDFVLFGGSFETGSHPVTQTPVPGLKVYTTTPTAPCFLLFCLDRLTLNNPARIKGRHHHKLLFF